MPSSSELHRLAARRGAKIEHFLRVAGNELRGKRGGEPLPPPAPFADALRSAPRALFGPHMRGGEGAAARRCSIGLGFRIVGKAEVEAWPRCDLAPRSLDRFSTPGGRPALLDVSG